MTRSAFAFEFGDKFEHYKLQRYWTESGHASREGGAMTTRQILQRRIRRWVFPVAPCLIGYVWIRHFGSPPGHVDYQRDDLALLTGGMIMAALSYLQYRILRAGLHCPRCKASLWHLQGELSSTGLTCPDCALDLDQPHDDRDTRSLG